MDNSMIESLLQALQASPDNEALQKLLIQAYVDAQEITEVLDLIDRYQKTVPPGMRLV